MTWLLTRGRVPYLCALLALTAFFGFHAARIPVERNNESLNSREALQAAVYDRFKASFGSDEDLLLAVTHPNLVSSDGLALLGSLTDRIARIDGVRRVFSLSNAQQVVAGEAGAELAPLVSPRSRIPPSQAGADGSARNPVTVSSSRRSRTRASDRDRGPRGGFRLPRQADARCAPSSPSRARRSLAPPYRVSRSIRRRSPPRRDQRRRSAAVAVSLFLLRFLRTCRSSCCARVRGVTTAGLGRLRLAAFAHAITGCWHRPYVLRSP